MHKLTLIGNSAAAQTTATIHSPTMTSFALKLRINPTFYEELETEPDRVSTIVRICYVPAVLSNIKNYQNHTS